MEPDSREPDHGDGLHEDLVKLASRRDALRIFGAGGATAILATLGASRAMAATPTGEVPTETAAEGVAAIAREAPSVVRMAVAPPAPKMRSASRREASLTRSSCRPSP